MKMKYFIYLIFVALCLLSIKSNEILNDLNLQEDNEITNLILGDKLQSKSIITNKFSSDKLKKLSARIKQKNDCSYFNFCNKNGDCIDGKCVCKNGWTNYDCSISKLVFILRSMLKCMFKQWCL